MNNGTIFETTFRAPQVTSTPYTIKLNTTDIDTNIKDLVITIDSSNKAKLYWGSDKLDQMYVIPGLEYDLTLVVDKTSITTILSPSNNYRSNYERNFLELEIDEGKEVKEIARNYVLTPS